MDWDTLVVASVSGIRGILNQDFLLTDLTRYVENFASLTQASEIFVARDTRRTGDLIRRTVLSALLASGANVVDYGVISTPALFRESLTSGRPAVMITASHNEPEWNGLKFVVNGRGIGQEQLSYILESGEGVKREMTEQRAKSRSRSRYDDDLLQRFGEGSCEGVKVALDLGGGAAIMHAPSILASLGCEVTSLNDTPGVFNRMIDPISDNLTLLQKIVKKKGCDIGLGFDCDGDRLVILDSEGRKRSGDYMLTMALGEILPTMKERDIVISVDTTQAVDELVKSLGGQVFRSKVGEANVIQSMVEKRATLGGEGSSGGLIDGGFNYCRDSMLAAITIIKAIAGKGLKAYDEVKSYHQTRVSLKIARTKALSGLKRLQKKYQGAETIDGIKVRLSSKSWVLIRPSGTEDTIRISAEAVSQKESQEIAKSFSRKLQGLSR